MRHGLSHAPHSQNAEDFATDLPSQEQVGVQGLPRSRSNQFLSLENAVAAFRRLFTGQNFGKLLVRVAPEPAKS
jgi:NADPH-dependent curcumin reductase CurA